MNPVESIQNKTNQMTEEFMMRIKKEIALWLFAKTSGLVDAILYIIFFLSSLIMFFFVSIIVLIFKGITDFNGGITYGATLLTFVSVILVSVLLSVLVKIILRKKYNAYKETILKEVGGEAQEV